MLTRTTVSWVTFAVVRTVLVGSQEACGPFIALNTGYRLRSPVRKQKWRRETKGETSSMWSHLRCLHGGWLRDHFLGCPWTYLPKLQWSGQFSCQIVSSLVTDPIIDCITPVTKIMGLTVEWLTALPVSFRFAVAHISLYQLSSCHECLLLVIQIGP